MDCVAVSGCLVDGWPSCRDEKHTEVGDIHILLADVETEDVRSFINELYGGNVTATAPITIFVSGAPPVPSAPVSRTQPSSAPPLRSSLPRTRPPRSAELSALSSAEFSASSSAELSTFSSTVKSSIFAVKLTEVTEAAKKPAEAAKRMV